MKNLAGVKDADNYIREELYLAGIPTVNKISEGEVPFTIIGKIGDWTFRRAWYYWVVSADELGLPLNTALELHNMKHPNPSVKIMGNVVRSGGHCGCPSPDEYGAQPHYDEKLEEQLLTLGYKKEYFELIKKEYIPITVGEISKLCNEGKLTVERYVDCYHVDDQIGLNEIAKIIKQL